MYVHTSYSDSLEFRDRTRKSPYNITGYPNCRIEPDSLGYKNFSHTHNSLFSLSKDRKLRFFFIKESTINKHAWEDICKYQLYEKMLVFTKKELIENDWVIKYQ